MKPILLTCLIVFLFASCSGRRYGHYGYVKKNEKAEKVIVKKDKKKHLSNTNLAARLPEPTPAVIDVDTLQAAAFTTLQHTTTTHLITGCNEPGTINRNASKTGKQTEKPGKTGVNSKATTSLAMSVLSFVVLLAGLKLSILLVLLAFIFGIIAIVIGINALAEIKKTGEDGAALAVISIILSSVSLLAVLITVAFFLLVLSLIFL